MNRLKSIFSWNLGILGIIFYVASREYEGDTLPALLFVFAMSACFVAAGYLRSLYLLKK